MATLTYDFRVIGLDTINRAFSSIEQRVVKHNALVTRATGVRSGGGSPEAIMAREEAKRQAAQERASAKMVAQAEREQKRIETARQREIERALKAEEKARIKAARDTAKKEEALAKAAAKREEALAREKTQRRQSWNREVVGAVGRGVGGVGRAAMTATGLAGGAWLGAATYGAVQQEANVRRLLINSRGAGDKALMSPQELQSQIRATSVGTGVGEGDITEGLSSFVARTGDLKTGVEMMQTLATTAQASGASFEDLAGVAADLMTKFDVTKVGDMQEALAGLVFQGKAGAFELRDMAAQFPKIGAMAKSMGMGGSEGLKKVGALAQIVRGSTGNAETATFALDALTRQLVSKGADMGSGKAFGGKKVNVFKNGDPTQGLRDITELIPEVLAASNGNLAQLQETFGGEGMRGMNAFLGTFRGAGGGEQGAAAVRAQIDQSVNAGGSWNEVQSDAREALKSTSAQLEILNTKFKAAVESDFLPALQELIPAVTKLAPLVGDAVKGLATLVKFFVEHPVAGLGAAITAAFVKEIAAAKIGDVLRSQVEKGTRTEGLLAGLAIATATLAVGMASIDVASESTAKGQSQAATLNARMGAVNAKARQEINATGGISESTRAEMAKLQEENRSIEQKANTGFFTAAANSVFGTGTGMSAYLSGSSAISAMNEGGKDSAASELGRMNALLKTYADSADKMAKAADKMAANSAGGAAPGTINRGNSPTTPG